MRPFGLLPIFALAGGLLLLDGCSHAALSPEDVPSSIVLERDSGLSDFPAYRVTLTPDGTVVFFGIAGVKAAGTHTRKIDPEKLQQVYRRLAQVDFWRVETMPDGSSQYRTANGETPISMIPFDAATQQITIVLGGGTRTILGVLDRRAPETALADAIDRVAGLSDWIGESPPYHR